MAPDDAKDLILELLDGDKAEDITAIDLIGKTSIADYMIVATGRSSRHVSAVASHISQKLKNHVSGGIKIEGQSAGDWVLVDAGDVIVHIFREEVRQFYQIEKIWMDPDAWLKQQKDTKIIENAEFTA